MPTAINSNPAITAWPRPECATSRGAAKSCETSTVAKDAKPSVAVDDAAATSPQQSSLESIMATLRRALSAVSDLGRWLDHVGSAAAVGVHAVSKQRTGIEIRTQEGDVIRINYSNRVEVDAVAAQASGDEDSVAVQQASLSQREHLRVSVKGDLNADELKAIDDVLAKVDSLAEEFFAGDFDKAFAHAVAFNFDSDQLAGVAVRLSQRQRVSVVTTSSNELPAPPKELPPESASPTSPPIEESTTIADPISTTGATNEVAQPIADVVAPTPAPEVAAPSAASIGQSIAQYVSRLTTSLRVTDGEARLGLTFHVKLDVLLASIKLNRPDDAAPIDTALNKLQDVAGKAAALA